MFGRRKDDLQEAAAVAAEAQLTLDTVLRTAGDRIRHLRMLPELDRFPASHREQVTDGFTQNFADAEASAGVAMESYFELAKVVPEVSELKDKGVRREYVALLQSSAATFFELAATISETVGALDQLTETLFMKLAECDALRTQADRAVGMAREALDQAARSGHHVSAPRRQLEQLIADTPVLADGVLYEGWSEAVRTVIAFAERIHAETGALTARG